MFHNYLRVKSKQYYAPHNLVHDRYLFSGLAEDPERSTQLISKAAIEQQPEPAPSIPNPVSLRHILMIL
jgi:hypothetical protein